MRIHTKEDRRDRIKLRLRKRIDGNSARPRLSVFRSLANISVQIIDDVKGQTLVAASSLEKDLRATTKGMSKTDIAKKIGALVAERAKRQMA